MLSAAQLNSKHCLIIGPNSVIENPQEWEKQITETITNANVNRKVRNDENLNLDNKKSNFTLLNYELLNYQAKEEDLDYLTRPQIPVDYLVVDEAHHLLNSSSNQYSNIKDLITGLKERNPDLKILFMSGTPIINNVKEAYNLHELLLQKRIPFNPANLTQAYSDANVLYNTNSVRFTHDPPYNHHEMKINIDTASEADRTQYHTEMQAREYLDTGAADRIQTKYKQEELCKNLKPGALVYCEYVDDLIPELKKFIDGNTELSVGIHTGDAKQDIADFKVGQKDVLIMSPAGAEGINLQEANSVHIFAGPWTHAKMTQVIGRAVRLGQEKLIDVYEYLITSNSEKLTPDENKQRLVLNKASLSTVCLDGSIAEANSFARMQSYLNKMTANVLNIRAEKIDLNKVTICEIIEDPKKVLILSPYETVSQLNEIIKAEIPLTNLEPEQRQRLEEILEITSEAVSRILRYNNSETFKENNLSNEIKKISKELELMEQTPLNTTEIFDRLNTFLKTKFEINSHYLDICKLDQESLKKLVLILSEIKDNGLEPQLSITRDFPDLYKILKSTQNKNSLEELKLATQIFLTKGDKFKEQAQNNIQISLDQFIKTSFTRITNLVKKFDKSGPFDEASFLSAIMGAAINMFKVVKKKSNGLYFINYNYFKKSVIFGAYRDQRKKILLEKDPALYKSIRSLEGQIYLRIKLIKEEHPEINSYAKERQKAIYAVLDPIKQELESLRKEARVITSEYGVKSLDSTNDNDINYHEKIAAPDAENFDQHMKFLLQDYDVFWKTQSTKDKSSEESKEINNPATHKIAKSIIIKMMQDPYSYVKDGKLNTDNEEIKALAKSLFADGNKGIKKLNQIYEQSILPFLMSRFNNNQ